MPQDTPERKLLPIPIAAGKDIADKYGYDQVIIIGRRVGENPDPNGEHITTYGVNQSHCDVAGLIGLRFRQIMKWPEENDDD